jgi:acyl-coenzyme A synthetase/AMP-(fatty) acid ligase
MNKPLPEAASLAGLIGGRSSRSRVIATRDHELALDDFERASSLASHLASLRGRSVVVFVRDMAKVAAALIDLDGCARRILLCPPGWEPSRLESAVRDAEADALVYDSDEGAPAFPVELAAPCSLPLQRLNQARTAYCETEWILPTSGTSGPPKFVAHTLRTLSGAITDTPLQQWATFYDIRRYGGLQIFLRAVNGRGSLTLGGEGESVSSLLARFAAVGITHISGTPSHWRRVLMSGEGRRIDPDYVRLSGEIADAAVLAALQALYPRARIEHAYASTEAGVVFVVDDGKAGFPASWLDGDGAVQMKIANGALCVRSDRCALRFLGADALPLVDKDGFVDTGDIIERRGDRLYFVGRRGGIINVGGAKVHPEEVEAALNAHAAVRASRVFARKSPITGALVFADVVLRDGRTADAASERQILAECRMRLPPHMVPAGLRFVADLPVTDGGKLARHG